MAKQQFWRKTEQQFYSICKDLGETLPLICHRFYDSRSAGSYLPNQPGDFLLVINGQAVLVEIKTSEKHSSLSSCFSSHVSKTQLAHHRLWMRAGAQCWFLFGYFNVEPFYELWGSDVCVEIGSRERARLPVTKRKGFSYDLDSLVRAIYKEAT